MFSNSFTNFEYEAHALETEFMWIFWNLLEKIREQIQSKKTSATT